MAAVSLGVSLAGVSLSLLGVVLGTQFGTGIALAVLGAGIAVIIAGIGSSVGVGTAGEAAAGVAAEDPEKFGRLILLQALPGTQGFYGLIGGFLVMNQLGFFTGDVPALTIDQGAAFFFACLPVAIAGLVSGVHQGRVSAAGIGLTAKRPEESGKALIMSAMVETYAVLGLLATLLLVNGIPV